jgi:hypothetical protein
MSQPDVAAPTTSVSPSRSWSGLRYALEWSCAIDESSSAANAGLRGFWNGPVATTTLSASYRSPAALDTT